MKNISISALLTAIVLLITASCDNGADCNINNVAYNRIQLYSAITDVDTIVSGKYSYPDTLTVKLVINGNDSIIVNRLVGASELQLPVSFTQECDTLVFEYSGADNDTLYIERTNIPYFVSSDCGMAMYHHLTGLRHTRSLIDSASINEAFINYDWNENIKLYIIE
ncbi:MAG: hypothetical protein IJB77_03365 [Bacteroidaceae bacterium]|nr:hypothetical protein [Bacteroidaceae bacterium]